MLTAAILAVVACGSLPEVSALALRYGAGPAPTMGTAFTSRAGEPMRIVLLDKTPFPACLVVDAAPRP